ncbi:N-acetyl-glucosamine transferase [Kitasatospora sp. MMS16-BH015]|uniref:glycosyltransferase n=1 Tax=Kitasatospora sp. MMS16-BH015 TaxID=2018025 RepID=UPI000CA3F0A5|nr:glycosyltransferase family 2 protein [Kitasatospora sp. MMS16-BH015]AUG81565.1 N-acetyl-glucosamine transferase [Kitasatospora sp. MMS16-BH015]
MIVLSSIQLLLVGLGLAYFLAMTASGLWYWARATKTPPGTAAETGETPQAVYVLIPCLNEEQVIAATVRGALADPRARVIVVDDASDDGTGARAREAATLAGAGGRLTVHRRDLPQARQGKGPALNAGYHLIEQDVRRRALDPDQVVVCVMDADGRLSDGALDAVLPLFEDPRVGGVQLAVRIRNRTTWLTRIQDVEFWALSGISQFGRVRTGTVSLGGNGQFTRLSALRSVGERPWAAALTEDLELALELAIAGWRLTTTPHAHVDQQALTSLRALVRQRTRWFQGHMTAMRHAPRIWTSPRIGHAASLELLLYLLVPWLLVLPWSVVFHLSLAAVVVSMGEHGGWSTIALEPGAHLQSLALWYCLSFSPNLATAFLYRRRDRTVNPITALVLGHLLIPANYIAYTACWRATLRMLRGRTGWAKTARVSERALTAVPLPAQHGAGRPAGRKETA